MKSKIFRIAVSLILVISSAATGTGAVCAQVQHRTETVITMQTNNPRMLVNGISVDIDDSGTVPVIRDGRTLMPIRAFAESIGANVVWNAGRRTVTITYNGKKIMLTIDDLLAYAGGSETRLDVPPIIINDRTFLPVRFVAESFGCEVLWDGETGTVTVNLSKENTQHAAVVYDGEGGERLLNMSKIIADLIGADLYTSDDSDFTAEKYDTVLLGYNGVLSDSVHGVLEGDFSGTNIAPFCVGGIGDTERIISLEAADAFVENGLEIPQDGSYEDGELISLAASWLWDLELIQR